MFWLRNKKIIYLLHMLNLLVIMGDHLFLFSADDWAGDDEEEEDGDGDSAEVKATEKKKPQKVKDKKPQTVKKAHMNIIFIGHVGKIVIVV